MPTLWKPRTGSVSGPVAMYEYRNVGRPGMTLHLIGDFHQSLQNACRPCKYPGCEFVVTMLNNFMKRHTDLQIDFYQELPYKHKDQTLEQIEAHAENVRGYLDAPDAFRQVYLRFRDSFYGKRGPGHVRFHYADIRDEQNVFSLTNFTLQLLERVTGMFARPDSKRQDSFEAGHETWLFMRLFMFFVQRLGDRASLQRFMEVYVDADNYYDTVDRMFHSRLSKFLGRLLRRQDSFKMLFSSSAQTDAPGHPRVHRVRKQLLKLPPPLRDTVRRYYGDTLRRVLDRHPQYPAAAALYSRCFPAKAMETEARFRAAVASVTLADARALVDFATDLSVLFLHLSVLLMDTYLIARMLHHAVGAEHRTDVAIVFAGNAHVDNYRRFLRDYMHARPVRAVPLRMRRDRTPIRCLRLPPRRSAE